MKYLRNKTSNQLVKMQNNLNETAQPMQPQTAQQGNEMSVKDLFLSLSEQVEVVPPVTRGLSLGGSGLSSQNP